MKQFFYTAAICLLCSHSILAQSPEETESRDQLFFFKPDTPARQVRGALLAERLDRPGLAQGYLNDLIDSNPSVEQLLDLRRQFGIGAFLKLSTTPSLQPTSQQLLKMINDAARQDAPSAVAVDALIAELGQSSRQTVDVSLRILAAENAAVVPLLAADVATPQGQIADQLLKRNVRRFRRGLVEALPDADDATQQRILKLLGHSAAPELALDLVRYQFSENADVAAEARTALHHLSGEQAVFDHPDQAAEMLSQEAIRLTSAACQAFPDKRARQMETDLARQQGVDENSTYGTALLQRAVRLSADAVAISPESGLAAATQLTSEMAEQSWPVRWNSQVVVSADGIDPAVTPPATHVTAFELALQTGNTAALQQMLAEPATSVAIARHEPALFRQTLLYHDVRVRLLAAAVARVCDLSSSYADNTIHSVIRGSERPEAVVIDSRSGESADAAAVMNERGYATAAALSGQSGWKAASGQLQCELVLVHSNCLRWSLSDTIANLRQDYRTASSPIVIYGPERDGLRTDSVRTNLPGIWFIPEPIAAITIQDYLQNADVRPPALTSQERKQMTRFARSLP